MQWITNIIIIDRIVRFSKLSGDVFEKSNFLEILGDKRKTYSIKSFSQTYNPDHINPFSKPILPNNRTK
jgi:hypothetical protein